MAEPMAANSGESPPQTDVSSSTTAERPSWRLSAMLTIALVMAVFALFWQTSWSVVSIWMRSETFTHGFLILPISAFLIWRKRRELLLCAPAPDWWGIPVLVFSGLGWLVAHSASVLVIEQLAMMAMVPTIVWTVLGWQASRIILFPLCFLFLAVPMGEELIPPMMDFTANFTVAALHLTGIPVYQEGTFFEIPGGHWSVVEGCSGVRYLIASVTLGCLYAYLTFRRLSRRLIFVALSVLVPVIANGLRAYMIVMIAYLSDMRLALGIDHLIYGWIFFGLVMLLLFWLGSFWREDDMAYHSNDVSPYASIRSLSPSKRLSLLKVSGVALITVAVWPALGSQIAEDNRPVHVSLTMPEARGGWQPATKPLTEWRPHYLNMDAALEQTYRRGDREVSVYLAYYRRQRQGAELINSDNVLIVQKHPVWRQTADTSYDVMLGDQHFHVRQAKVRSARQNLLVWYWYWVDGHTTTNHYLAKLWDAKAKLLGETGDAAAVMVSTAFSDQGTEAAKTLEEFMTTMQASIEASLEDVVRE